MKIIPGVKKLSILFIISVLLFINVIPSLAVNGNLNYYYDDLNRLIFVEDISNGTLFEYEYDEVGNRTQKGTHNSYYTVRPIPESNGTIMPSSPVPVHYKSSQTFTITPNARFEILKVYVDGVEVQDAHPETHTIENVTADHTIRATFIHIDPVSIGDTYYQTLQEAYEAASDGSTIKVTNKTLTENLFVDRDISINLEGGYDPLHTTLTGNTTLQGKIETSHGTITIKNFILQN